MQRFADIFAAQPVASCFALAVMSALAGLAAFDIWRRRGDRAVWWVAGIILASMTFAIGEDIDHHIYRVVALAEQLRAGQPSLLLTNPVNGEALPTFVYYSFVPYLPAVVLNLAGSSAHAAFKLVMGAALIVMALGLRRLVEHVSADARARNAGYLIAILFLCVNYVYGLWLQRMAFAEIWVYCLIPWVILMLARAKGLMPLVALLFLQIAGHPIVFAQAFICSLLVAWALSVSRPLVLIRHGATATVIALILASPFWLPQFFWQALILGAAGLPVRFADTFLSAGELVDRRFMRGVGFGLPLAVILMAALAKARLSRRAWTLVAAFVVVLALQTVPFRLVAERVPLLPTSLFVWRLMFPAAVLGLGALWAGWRPGAGRDRVLAAVTLLSLLSMLVVLVGNAPANLAAAAAPKSDQTWYRAQLAENLVWGRREFLPNYGTLPQKCDLPSADMQTASFVDLQRGIPARLTFVVVPAAPVGLVDYSVDGVAVPLAACGEGAVFGPLKLGAVVKASSGKLTILLWVRLLCLLAWAIAFVLMSRLKTGWRRGVSGH